MRRTLVRLTSLLALAAAVAPAAPAQDAASAAVAEPALSYPVTAEAGPWMICAACYDGQMYGPKARLLAEELVQQIRAHYRLPAYGFNRGAEERRKEQERVAEIKRQQREWLERQGLPLDTQMRSPKTVRIQDQFAVLVGGYKDMESARKALDEIRKLEPPKPLQHAAYVPDASGRMQEQSVNPFRSAFVCRNPTVPAEKPAQDNKFDPRLKEYNVDEKYSLLKCPRPWTLVVKTYRAPAVVQSQSTPVSVMEKLGLGKKAGDVLNASAKQAHEVADFLRRFGLEAYVLHTEYSSIVSVGGFDGPDDPRLVELQQAFVRELNNPISNIGQLHVKAQVQFMTEPMPMMVPKVQ